MPTQLTTPEVRVSVTTATVDSWGIELVRNAALAVDTSRTILTAKVTLRDSTGKELDTKTLRRDYASLPQGLRTQLAATHSALVTALRAAGVLPAGTDTTDI